MYFQFNRRININLESLFGVFFKPAKSIGTEILQFGDTDLLLLLKQKLAANVLFYLGEKFVKERNKIVFPRET